MFHNHEQVARGPSQGSFLIPAIDPEVPASLARSASRGKLLARFAKAAAAEGLPLPKGDFLSIDDVVTAQWSDFLGGFPQGAFQQLVGEPSVTVNDSLLGVVIGACSSLQVFQLKPVISQLEEAAAGLGWFVHRVIETAGYHGHDMYDMARAAYMLESLHWDLPEYTDQAYARRLLEEQGTDVPEGDIPEALIEELRSQYMFWPSDLMNEVGGHKHLLGMGGPRPRTMSATAARKWLAASADDPRAVVVRSALDLHKATKADSARDFLWNRDIDDYEPMGALCFVCWDSPHMLMEAVGHHEQMAYQGGEAIEAFARNVLPLADGVSDEELRELARATANYFKRWALLARLLSHFPVWKDDDET